MTGWYLAISLAMTWPLATSLTRRLPVDLGDPLLNCWILQWDLDHFLRVLGGDWQALRGFFDGNLFYPEPLVLAYSEHLVAQALQALPLYAATGNILLCYNALFLSTFVLSGLGVFLFVRELTGSARAAFVAGLFYAFTPYRLGQLGHLQVLSSQWMPFALYGLRRWLDSDRKGPLVGAVAALTLQNLSCGYYLLYFPPFVTAYAVWELARRGRLRDGRAWLHLAAAAAGVAALTIPFLIPYLQLRQHGFGPRPFRELRSFSADATSYLAASDRLWLWPNGFSRQLSSEALLFPGFTPLALATLGIACLVVVLRRRVLGERALRGWRLAVAFPVGFLALAAADLVRFELFAGRKISIVRRGWPWLSDVRRGIAIGIVSVLALVALSPRVRAAARLGARSGRVFFAAAFCAAVWLSFGPQVRTRQHALTGPTFYAWLYDHVPGFDGLRVPGRYGMLAMLFLAVVAGYGARALAGAARPADGQGHGLRRDRRWRSALLAVAGAFFLLESTGAPLHLVALEWARKDGRTGVVSATDMEPVYGYIRRMPPGTVVAEFPFGDLPQGETRAVFLSTRHGHPILNGYSGGFPASYNQRKELLQNPVAAGEAAWQALLDSGATCVVVHEWAFDAGDGGTFSRWLEQHGAVPLARFRSDRIYAMPR